MASTTSRPKDNGTGSPDFADGIMLDEEKLRELSSSYPISQNSLDYNGNWDFLSPSSSVSTTPSIGSPAPSSGSVTRSRSKAMKPRRNQSSYYDEGLGVWKCRNCGGTYEMPNPGSRQRREHKKACEETQRVKALQRAQQEEKARRDQAARRENAFEEASKLLERKDNVREDSGSTGGVSSTPDIPEVEEVNFGAPKELIYNVELEARKSDAARRVQEAEKVDEQAESDKIEGEEPRPGQAGAELAEEKHHTVEPSDERELPSETNRPAEGHVPSDTDSSPLKTEYSEEFKPSNDSSTLSSDDVHRNGSLDQQWSDKNSPLRRIKLLDESEQVKYCSNAASGVSPRPGTLYDELVDLHDDAQMGVTRSASLGPGMKEAARISSLNQEIDEVVSKNFTRAISMDHYGIDIAARKDYGSRVSRLGTEADEPGPRKDKSTVANPEDWLDVLVGKDLSRSPILKQGVESPLSRVSKTSSGDSRIDFSPTNSPSSATTKRRLSYTPREVASSSKQSQSGSPQVGARSKKPSDSREGDDDLVGMITRTVGQFWKHIAAVGAVAVVAWVGKSLAARQQPPRRPKYRRGHFAVNSYYWDDE